jgi:hypothetical protein
MGLEIVRGVTLALSFAALAAAVRWRRSLAAFLNRFFFEPLSPVNLAALRVLVFLPITQSALGRRAGSRVRPMRRRSVPRPAVQALSPPRAASAQLRLRVSRALLLASDRHDVPVSGVLQALARGGPLVYR